MAPESSDSPASRDTMDEMTRVPSCTDLDVSTEKGKGESSMTGFIQNYMMSILKPFASHVEDLHARVDQLQVDISAIMKRIDDSSAITERYESLISGLRVDTDQLAARVDANQENALKANEAAATLDQDIKEIQSRLGGNDERLQSADTAIEGLQRSLKDSRSKVSKLREGLVQTDRSVASLHPAVEQLSADHKKLEDTHNDRFKQLDEVNSLIGRVQEELQAFQRRSEQQWADDKATSDSFKAQLTDLGIESKNSCNKLIVLNEFKASTTNALNKSRKCLDQLQASLDEAKVRMNATDVAVMDLDLRSKDMAIQVAELTQFMRQLNHVKNPVELLLELRRNCDSLIAQVKDLNELTEGHTNELSGLADRATELEGDSRRLADKIVSLEKAVGVDSMDLSAEARKQSKFLQLVKEMSLVARQRQTQRTIEEHSSEILKTSAALSENSSLLDSTESRVKILEAQFQTTVDELAKLSQGLDLTQEYWKGLRKGLKETKRCVHVEGEVLPPQKKLVNATGTMLPALITPSTPNMGKDGSMTAR
mmetsp:Transcript_86520/g.242274  ORF Transcript_86520/g.242274 Transcript_86520/m.242274 type:complete len:540 (-) Transcript_86520:65-1684(-)